MIDKNVSIDDKYDLARGRALLSGVQALTRLPMMQKEWDRAAGLNTAGFISGYPGSPIGEFDSALLQARKHLVRHDVVFQPGLNEDLAATSVWGTQQLENFQDAKRYDGVFALWYGKGPGVDRSGDAIKHGNFTGAHPRGGVLAVYGDDHNAKSSSIAHQCDQAFAANFVPILYPASVHEYLEYGLKGWALSRYTGLWVGFKGVNETLAQTATIDLDLDPSIVKASNRAIELNGTSVSFNKLACRLGRLAAHDVSALNRLIAGKAALPPIKREEGLEDVVAHRSAHLTKYQDAAYARRYVDLVNEVAAREKEVVPESSLLAIAVARNLAKLMAYKDEYEVARLHSTPEFLQSLREEFSGDFKLRFNLAPPLLARRDPQTGRPVKREYGGWVSKAFRLLARFKALRGTPFDIVGYTAERKAERRLIVEYSSMIRDLLPGLTPENHAVAVKLTTTPDRIRGYGFVKERNIQIVEQEQAELLEWFRSGGKPSAAAQG